MDKLDQFESAFRAAAKEPFQYEKREFRRVLVITDKDAQAAAAYAGQAHEFLEHAGIPVEVRTALRDETKDLDALLGLVAEEAPDLICTYRHLHKSSWKYGYSLGAHVDVMTGSTEIPVLLTPHPDAGLAAPHSMQDRDVTMVLTDHLSGDHEIVNVGVAFTQRGGRLLLAHIEDQQAFEHYMEIISKLPDLNTTQARHLIRERLLKEPEDYAASCADALAEAELPLEIEVHIALGHQLRDYRKLVTDNAVDILVMRTKSEDQLAMSGLAYALSVELRSIPVLLI